MIAVGTALTGIQASVARLNASASNIANVESVGPVQLTPPSQPVRRENGQAGVYQAMRAQQSDVASGGTVTRYRPVTPSYVLRYDPGSSYADAQGLVAAPNVDITSELIEQLAASLAFKANLKIIETADRLDRSVLERWA